MQKWQLKAIRTINPNAEDSTKSKDENVVEIEWAEGTSPISLDEINIKAEELKASEEYADLRVAEYPTMADQLDDIYHNGIDGWKATIKAVKDKYPKEE